MNFFVKGLATGLGAGYFPVMPGTAGSAVAAAAYFFLWPDSPSLLNSFVFFIIILLTFFAGVWSGTRAEAEWGEDPSRVVIDEIAGMWIALFLIPNVWYWILTAFILFRTLDMTKWFGIDKAQEWPGGWGIMMDDVFAGILSNVIVQFIIWFSHGF